MEPERSVVVYGAGAVGCYLGAKLATRSNTRVTLVGRPTLQDAVEDRGLILREGEIETIAPVTVVTSSASLPPADLVVLTVRTFDVAAALPDLRALVGEHGMLIAMQNGVGTEEELAVLGRDRFLVGTLTSSVGMSEAGIVAQFSRGGGIALATMTAASVPASVVDLFTTAGLTTVTIENYRSLRWSKLLLNMLGAAQSAILDMDIGLLIEHPALFRVEQLALREAGRVMDALDIDTVALPGYPVPLVRRVMRLPRRLAQPLLAPRLARSRGGRSPTMRADMARGKTEVATLNGAVAKAAAEAGLRAPVNAALAELTEQLAANPEPRETFRGQPERLLAFLRVRGINV
jgi:2-dehydropantoate 2-reductase